MPNARPSSLGMHRQVETNAYCTNDLRFYDSQLPSFCTSNIYTFLNIFMHWGLTLKKYSYSRYSLCNCFGQFQKEMHLTNHSFSSQANRLWRCQISNNIQFKFTCKHKASKIANILILQNEIQNFTCLWRPVNHVVSYKNQKLHFGAAVAPRQNTHAGTSSVQCTTEGL